MPTNLPSAPIRPPSNAKLNPKCPLVSVIIPAYNGGNWLAEAIDSALSQTYPCVQVIVVNDGSPDPITRETASHYVGRIIYIERENGGVATARNTGIEASNGDLIALLDQDDLWLPHKLATQVAAMQEGSPDLGLVHSSFYTIDLNGQRTGIVRLPQRNYRPLPAMLLQVPIASCTTMFPRHALDKIGLFDPALTGADDWDLWLRMATKNYNFFCIAEPLASYREHQTNTSHNIDLMVRSSIRTLDKFYALPGLPDTALRHRARAYFNKHIWAASLYYGASAPNEARTHLQSALHFYPQGVVSARSLQSLVQAGRQPAGPPPGHSEIETAAQFIHDTLNQSPLPTSVKRKLDRKLTSRTHLLHAFRSPSPLAFPAAILRALRSDPFLLTDPHLWSALVRIIRTTKNSRLKTQNS